MAYPKRRVLQHVMEDRSIRIVRDLLPDHWVVREYRPDYGIDLLIELFEFVDAERTEAATLGETLFVQVKSTEVVEIAPHRVYRRGNVALGPLQEDRAASMEMDVARLQLETSELLTVQAIGSAIPVLLLLVELSTGRIYYVCLNDLVEKVILPQDPAYEARDSKVLHIPARNCIVAGNPLALRPLETYAKRAKLYAAFAKFAYQNHELQLALGEYDACPAGEMQRGTARRLMGIVRHFLSIALRYDFWTRIPAWKAIELSHIELQFLARFLRTPGTEEDLAGIREYLVGQPAYPLMQAYVAGLELPEARWHLLTHISQVWDRLDNLSRMYEELVREWFLPTELAMYLGQDLRGAGDPARPG